MEKFDGDEEEYWEEGLACPPMDSFDLDFVASYHHHTAAAINLDPNSFFDHKEFLVEDGDDYKQRNQQKQQPHHNYAKGKQIKKMVEVLDCSLDDLENLAQSLRGHEDQESVADDLLFLNNKIKQIGKDDGGGVVGPVNKLHQQHKQEDHKYGKGKQVKRMVEVLNYSLEGLEYLAKILREEHEEDQESVADDLLFVNNKIKQMRQQQIDAKRKHTSDQELAAAEPKGKENQKVVALDKSAMRVKLENSKRGPHDSYQIGGDGKGDQVEAAAKLEESKTRIHQSYKRIQEAKNRRQIQVIGFQKPKTVKPPTITVSKAKPLNNNKKQIITSNTVIPTAAPKGTESNKVIVMDECEMRVKLENSKKRLHESYQRIEDAKKSRMTQLIDPIIRPQPRSCIKKKLNCFSSSLKSCGKLIRQY